MDRWFMLVLGVFAFCLSSGVKPVLAESEGLRPGFELHSVPFDPDRPVAKSASRYSGPIIDSHVHIDPPNSNKGRGEFANIFESMSAAGVSGIVVMPSPNEGRMRGGTTGAELRSVLAAESKGSVRVFCGGEYISYAMHKAYHTKSKPDVAGILNRLQKEISFGTCVGIGEVGTTHFQKWGKQAVIDYPMNYEPFVQIVGFVARNGLWLDLHAEPMEPNGKSREAEVFGGVEYLLRRYPDLKIIWSHTAMTNPENARRILKKYPNVMMNLKHIRDHSKWRNLEPVTNEEGRVYQDWMVLFEEMPERFMIGTDAKMGREKRFNPAGYTKAVNHIRRMLGGLSPDAARKMAYENARAIFW